MKLSKTISLRFMLLWGIASVFLSTNTFAQTAKVSGTIINQRTSTPVSGATVAVKNTSRATVTDDAGKFTIDASTGETLVITSVGFATQEAKVGSGDVRVQLQETTNEMENVVVIGYGTQKKKLTTGANLQVPAEGGEVQHRCGRVDPHAVTRPPSGE